MTNSPTEKADRGNRATTGQEPGRSQSDKSKQTGRLESKTGVQTQGEGGAKPPERSRATKLPAKMQATAARAARMKVALSKLDGISSDAAIAKLPIANPPRVFQSKEEEYKPKPLAVMADKEALARAARRDLPLLPNARVHANPNASNESEEKSELISSNVSKDAAVAERRETLMVEGPIAGVATTVPENSMAAQIHNPSGRDVLCVMEHYSFDLPGKFGITSPRIERMPKGIVETLVSTYTAQCSSSSEPRWEEIQKAMCLSAQSLCNTIHMTPERQQHTVYFAPIAAIARLKQRREDVSTPFTFKSIFASFFLLAILMGCWYNPFSAVESPYEVVSEACDATRHTFGTVFGFDTREGNAIHLTEYSGRGTRLIDELQCYAFVRLVPHATCEQFKEFCNSRRTAYGTVSQTIIKVFEFSSEIFEMVSTERVEGFIDVCGLAMCLMVFLASTLHLKLVGWPVLEEALRTLPAPFGLLATFVILSVEVYILHAKGKSSPWSIFRRSAGHLLLHLISHCVPQVLAVSFHVTHNYLCDEEDVLDVGRLWFLSEQASKKCHPCVSPGGVLKRRAPFLDKDPEKCNPIQTLDGIGVEGFRPVVFGNTHNNLDSAIEARAITRPLLPNRIAIRHFLTWCKKYRHVLMPVSDTPKRLSFADAIKRSGAAVATKQKVSKAYEELKNEHVPWKRVPKDVAWKYANRQLFVKAENNNYRNPMGTKKKAARLVCKMDDAYQALTIQDVDLLCQHVDACMDGSHGFMSACGRTNEHVAAHLMGSHDPDVARMFPEGEERANRLPKNPLNLMTPMPTDFWLVDDMAAFDSSYTVEWKKFWIFLATQHFRAFRKRTASLYEASVITHGSARGFGSIIVPSLKTSGNGDTLHENNILNMLLHCYSACLGDEARFLDGTEKFDSSVYLKFKKDEHREYFYFKSRLSVPKELRHLAFSPPWGKQAREPNIVCVNIEDAIAMYEACGPEILDGKIRAVCMGDDFTANVHADLVSDHLGKNMALLGIKNDCFYTQDSFEVEFCSHRLIPDPLHPVFVPKAGRVLAKMAYFVNPPQEVPPDALVRGSVLSMYASASHCPILRRVFDVLLRKTQHVEPYFVRDVQWRMKNPKIFDETSVLSQDMRNYAVHRHYGLCDEDVSCIERTYENAQLGETVDSPLLHAVLSRDTDGPDYLLVRQELRQPSVNRVKSLCRQSPRRHRIRGFRLYNILSLLLLLTLTFLTEDALVGGWTSSPWPAQPLLRTVGEYKSQGKPVQAVRVKVPPDIVFECHCGVAARPRPILNRMVGIVEMSTKNKQLKNIIKKEVKQAKKAAKKKVAIKEMASIMGHGDYRPTAFARVKGRGDYFKDLGSAIGGGVGGLADTGVGLFKAITGMGDYRTHGPTRNTLLGLAERQSAFPGASNPQAMSMGAAAVRFAGGKPRITHREYICPIYASSQFQTTVIRLQPGLSGNRVWMPWGSSVAKNFQQYNLQGAIFEYVSTASAFAANLGMGEVSMSTLYDANATPMASVQEINNNEYTTINKPSESFIHPIECKESAIGVRYVRSSNSVVLGNDERFDDVGVFQISTVGMPSESEGVQIGELWCMYDIEYLKPTLPDLHVGTTYGATITKSASNTWALTPNPGNSLPVVFDTPSSALFRVKMPAGYNGNYLFIVSTLSSGTYVAGGSQLTDVGSDITSLLLLPSSSTAPSGAATFGAGGGAGATGSTIFLWSFSTIAQGTGTSVANTFNFTAQNTSGTAVAFNVFIVPLDNDVTDVLTRARKYLKNVNPAMLATLGALSAVNSLSSSSSSVAAPPTSEIVSNCTTPRCIDTPVTHLNEDYELRCAEPAEEEKFIRLDRSVHIPKDASLPTSLVRAMLNLGGK